MQRTPFLVVAAFATALMLAAAAIASRLGRTARIPEFETKCWLRKRPPYATSARLSCRQSYTG